MFKEEIVGANNTYNSLMGTTFNDPRLRFEREHNGRAKVVR